MTDLFWFDLLYAVLFGALLSVFFYAFLKTRGPWSSFLLLFLVIFLASWAGGVWLSPVGPGVRTAHWLPFLLSGLLIALLLAAAAPSRSEESTVELMDERDRKRERRKIYRAISRFFWILIGALVLAIVGHYLARAPL